MQLIQAYQKDGHVKADLDPLKFTTHFPRVTGTLNSDREHPQPNHKGLDFKHYGFTEADLEKEFFIDAPGMGGFLSQKKNWKLKDLLQALNKAYSEKIAVEYSHITNEEEVNWIRNKIENSAYEEMSKDDKIKTYSRLLWAH